MGLATLCCAAPAWPGTGFSTGAHCRVRRIVLRPLFWYPIPVRIGSPTGDAWLTCQCASQSACSAFHNIRRLSLPSLAGEGTSHCAICWLRLRPAIRRALAGPMVCRVNGLAYCLSRISTWQGASPYGVPLGRPVGLLTAAGNSSVRPRGYWTKNFKTELEAAEAHDSRRRELGYPEAKMNFPKLAA